MVSLLEISGDLTGHIQANGLNGIANFAVFEKELYALLNNTKSTRLDDKTREESLQYAISFYEQNKSFIRKSSAWNYFLKAGRELSHQGQWQLAQTCLEHSHRLARGREQIEDSLFHAMFMYVLKNDKQGLFSFIDDKKLLKQFDNLDSKLQFWIAYSLEKNGKKEVSSRLFERLLTNSPLSFYTVVAQREYQILNDRPFVPPALDLPQIARDDLSDEFKATLKRLRLWVQVEDSFLAENEINQIRKISSFEMLKNKTTVDAADLKRFAMLHTTELLNFENAYLTSFKLLYRALDDGSLPVSEAAIGHLFPAPYLDEIKKIDSDIDPLLILSLVRQESAFNPNARSHVGARGLMQLMPATARELKRGVKTTQLSDPNLNLRLGIRYFKRLLKKYDGNLIHTLAAYNAGQGNLKRWMDTKLAHEDPLVIVESIPFEETRKYVKLIYRNIFFYKYLAKEVDYFKLPIAQSFNTRAIATAGDISTDVPMDIK